MKKVLTTTLVLIFLMTALFPAAETFGSLDMVEAANADYNMFKCPAFPNGYALPKDLLIKFFAMRTSFKFGRIQKLVFNINTNKNLGKVKFKLYSGIPKNPLAAVVDFLPPTAEIEAEWKDGTQLVFESLDILVPPGYPQSFTLKAEPAGLARGDWMSISIDLCEKENSNGEILCMKNGISREIKFFY